MATVEASVEIAAPLAEVWDLYFDRAAGRPGSTASPRSSPRDGYPETGRELVWRSTPAGPRRGPRARPRARAALAPPDRVRGPGIARASSRRASRSSAGGERADERHPGARLPAQAAAAPLRPSPICSSSAARCAARWSARSATCGSRPRRRERLPGSLPQHLNPLGAQCSSSRLQSSAPARWAARSPRRSPPPTSTSCSRTSTRSSSTTGSTRPARSPRASSTGSSGRRSSPRSRPTPASRRSWAGSRGRPTTRRSATSTS